MLTLGITLRRRVSTFRGGRRREAQQLADCVAPIVPTPTRSRCAPGFVCTGAADALLVRFQQTRALARFLPRASSARSTRNGRSPLELSRPALSAAHAAEHSSALHLSLRAECALQFAFQVTRRGRRQAAACGCSSRRPHAAGAAAGGLPRPAWRDAGRAEPHPPLQGARHLHRQLRRRLVGLLGVAGSGEGYGWGEGEGEGEGDGNRESRLRHSARPPPPRRSWAAS